MSTLVRYLDFLSDPLSREEIRARLLQEPAWNQECRALPTFERQMGIASISEAYFPLPAQCRLTEELQLIIRSGYRNRVVDTETVAPGINKGTSQYEKYDCKLLDVHFEVDNSHLSACLLGYPGTGKSSAVGRALALLAPRQIIKHQAVSPQVVWLKVPCPISPTLKSFCIAFYEALSGAVKDPQIKRAFGHHNADVDQMPREVVRLARNHAIGVLVVENVHNLAKASEAGRILGLLEDVSGEAGVPIYLVGTNAAAEVIHKAPRTALRSVGFGSEVWERMPQGPEWDQFLGRLWKHQWTRKETPLMPKLSSVFYDHSQGIVSLAVKLYQRTQSAIIRQAEILRATDCSGDDAATKEEVITPSFVEAVADYLFGQVHPLLDALRTRDPAKLFGFEDFRPLPREAKRMQEDLRTEQKVAAEAEPEKPAVSPEEAPDATDEEIREAVKSADETAALMMRLGRSVLLQAGCSAEEAGTYLDEIVDTLEGKLAQNQQKFFKEIDRRIEKRKVELRRVDDPQAARDPNTFEEGDLRRVLGRQGDVVRELKRASIDGRRGLARR
jgi:hypothetical protein